MKRIYSVLLLTIISVISFKCQKDFSGRNAFPGGQGNNQSSPITATLQGNILDENDQPVQGAVITTETKTVITNIHGYFRIVEAPLDENSSMVTAEQLGYFKAYRTFRATTGVNQVVIKLIKKTFAGTIDATTGGSVSMPDGAQISLPANGVINTTGNAYTGSIKVYASYINPTSNDIGKIVPGSFMADDKDNKRVVLSSYGMLAVNLESSSGEKLQIAANNTATLTIPIPSSIVSSAPATISLWYIDEQTGIWKEQGFSEKKGNNYVGVVKHFTYWNNDTGLTGVSFSATFKTEDGAPLTNTYVVVRPTGNQFGGCAHGYTDSLGQVSGLIPSGINLTLEVYGGCNRVVDSSNIGPFTGNTNLGTIVVPNSIPSLITVKGKLLDCNNAPVANGYAAVYFDNMVYNASVTPGGEFSISFIECYSIPQTFEVFGVDETSRQQGPSTTISVTGPLMDVGNISACGTSSVQYLNYTLDGTDYTSSIGDSISAVAVSNPGSLGVYDTFVNGWYNGNVIGFNFSSNATAGAYPLKSLSVLNYTRSSVTQPLNISLTAFPLNRGEFYDGSFSGSFKDSSDLSVNHTISCAFHIRKY